MGTSNFYASDNGIFAFGMNTVDELDYELERDTVLDNLIIALEKQGHTVTILEKGQTTIDVDGLVKMHIEPGYYEGAQIVIDRLENETIADNNYLDLEDDYYKKVFVYLDDENDEERYTATPDEDNIKASQIEDILYNVAWNGDAEETPIPLSDIKVTSINHPDYTMLDYQVVNALETATTKYNVAYQFNNGETGYTLAN